jgi:hypothetical protein
VLWIRLGGGPPDRSEKKAASLPGFKDRHEIRALLAAGGGRGTPAVLKAASEQSPAELADLMAEAFGYLARAEPPLVIPRPERLRLSQIGQEWIAGLPEGRGIDI